MKRRNLLTGMGSATLLGSTPLSAQLLPTIDATLKVSVGFNVDTLANEFYENTKSSALYLATKGTREFFANMGNPYGLPGLHIADFDEIEKIQGKEILLTYSSKEQIVAEIRSLDEQITQKDFEALFERTGTITLPRLNKIYIFGVNEDNPVAPPGTNEHADEALVLQFRITHAVGHLFGLEEGKESYNPMNIQASLEGIYLPMLPQQQVERVLKHFGK